MPWFDERRVVKRLEVELPRIAKEVYVIVDRKKTGQGENLAAIYKWNRELAAALAA